MGCLGAVRPRQLAILRLKKSIYETGLLLSSANRWGGGEGRGARGGWRAGWRAVTCRTQPRPTNGMFVAMTVIASTLALSGSEAM